MFEGPVNEIRMSAGVLITSNVVLFGMEVQHGVFTNDELFRFNVTIGNRPGSQETREIVQLKQVATPTHSIFAIGVLNIPSNKTPVTLDDGSCSVTKGCLDVTILGRGTTEFILSDPFGSEPEPSLDQVLQKIETKLLSPTECANAFDLDNMDYDYYYAYYEALYDCPGLDCPGVFKPGLLATIQSYSQFPYIANFYEPYLELFKDQGASCFISSEQDLCRGDPGAPALVKDQDILIGIFPKTVSCVFAGEINILPLTLIFTSDVIDSIRSEISNLPSADENITTADAGLCTCSTENDDNPTINYSVLLPSLAAAFLVATGSFVLYRKSKQRVGTITVSGQGETL